MTTTTPSFLTRACLCGAGLLLSGTLFGGCTTVEKINGVEYPVEDSPREDETEKALIEALEENDENLPAWFALGEHYEKGLRYDASYNAFRNFQLRLSTAEEKQKVPLVQQATLGLDAMARLALKLGSTDPARLCCVELLRRQPKSLKTAKHNPHFRIAHLRLAKIYFAREEDEQAHLHAMIHKELGGTQSDGILIGLDERARQKKKGAKSVVQPSHEQGQGESQPAGSRK
jgi:tetratricopeptide (TPR) repeat protein